jgi:hypothetical protein
MRTFNLRHQAIPLGLSRSDWLILSIIVTAGRSLVRPLAVFVCSRPRTGCAGPRARRAGDRQLRYVPDRAG